MEGPVCITGATGFIGAHVVEAFLAAGAEVRAAVRSPDDPQKTAPLRAMAERHPGELSFCAADLSRAGSFDAALEGCAGLIHTAAAVTLTAKDPQRDIVDPSVEGSRHVLASATKAGVQTVVMTSSVAAVGGHEKAHARPLTEEDWNDEATLKTEPYGVAKREAERLAYALEKDAPWRLVTINPSLVIGPVFTPAHTEGSTSSVRDVLAGTFPAIPQITFGCVDVRDVVLAHLRAYERPEARGRYILSAEPGAILDFAHTLKAAYPARKITTRKLPNFMLRIAAVFDSRMTQATLDGWLGYRPQYDGSRATRELGIDYHPIDEAVRMAADSMISQGFV